MVSSADIPGSIPSPLAARIRQVLALDPARGAIEQRGQWLSWAAVSTLMAQLDELLQARAPQPGAAIGMVLRNRPAHVAALLEVLLGGRCVVTINPFQSQDKLAADIAALRCPVLLADAEDWPLIDAAAGAAGGAGLILEQQGDAIAVRAHPLLERPRAAELRAPMPGIAIEMLTSGTTGPAKRVKLPYANLEHALLDALFYEGSDRDVAPRLRDAVAFASAPLVHIGGIWTVVSAFLAGRAIVLLEKFNVPEWHAAVLRHRPKVAALPPTALRMVYDAGVPPEDLRSLMAIRSATAPLDPDFQERFETRYGIPVLNAYGATEFAGGVAGWTLEDHRRHGAVKRGSVGRAQPGCALRIVDRDSGVPLPAGQVGLLEVKARHVGNGDWLRTTDLAELDGDGFLFMRGRADDAIIRGGFKVLPDDVAKVLRQHPSVKDASVVGLPDERLGAVPVAAVELHEDANPVSDAELLALARQHLVSYQVPVRLRIVDALPRTPSLKVSQPAVRALFTEPG
jgi:long-chain acyl-CoA synthetase